MSSPSFFSSDEFLGALAAAHHPGKPWRIELVEVEGQCFRVLVVGRRVVDAQWTHPFRYDAWEGDVTEPARSVPFLALATLGVRDAPLLEPLPSAVAPSPFIDWRGFSSWRDYQDFARGDPGAHWKTVARLRRKLEREHGPLEFCLDDRRDDVVPCMAVLKGAHFRRTGHLDWFQIPSTVGMYEELQSRGVFTYATLRANGRLVTIFAGSHWQRRYMFRTLTYDREFAAYSPGLMLLHYALREAFDRGDEEWDFLTGKEGYKWQYATHYRVLGPMGYRPRGARVDYWLRWKAGTALATARERIHYARRAARG